MGEPPQFEGRDQYLFGNVQGRSQDGETGTGPEGCMSQNAHKAILAGPAGKAFGGGAKLQRCEKQAVVVEAACRAAVMLSSHWNRFLAEPGGHQEVFSGTSGPGNKNIFAAVR